MKKRIAIKSLSSCPAYDLSLRRSGNPKCRIDTKCFHRVEGKCCYIEAGNSEEFAMARGLKTSKFQSLARSSAERIQVMYMVDAYYTRVLESMGNAKIVGDGKEREFPFDFDDHLWGEMIFRHAIFYDNIKSFQDSITCERTKGHFLSFIEAIHAELNENTAVNI